MEPPISILFVDDDEEDFLITRDLLEELPHRKYKLHWVQDYHEAKKHITKQDYDVILLDYRLGAEDGLDLVREHKQEELSGPIILLTGQEDQELDDLAKNTGVADYLVKSKLEVDVLDRSIRYNIEQFKNMRQIRDLNKTLEKRVEGRTKELQQAVSELEKRNARLNDEIKRRKETEEALHESQQMYYAITSNFPNGSINIFDRNLTYVFSDGMEMREFGMDKSLLRGVNLLDHVEPEAGEVFKAELEKVFHGKSVAFEIPLKERYFMIYGVPLPTQKGEMKHIMVVAQNITEQKNSEKKIKKSLEKERELNELKSRFVSMASHEFRTPLASVMSSITLIDKYRERNETDAQVRHIQKIKNNVSILTQILNDFLSLGKLEEGKVTYTPREVEVVSLVEETVEDLQELAKKDQVIDLEHNCDDLYMQTDQQVLKNILYNLISNAGKYSNEGTTIRVNVEDCGGEVKISVEDEGMGIPEKEQKLLFERFFRASNAQNVQGTGLGLNIVKKYVDLMDGNIEFTSKLNEGTTFTVTIPKVSHEEDIVD